MRARSHNSRVVLGNRPFSGDLGASLYVGTPDAQAIRYRRTKCVCPGSLPYPVSTTDTIDPGAETVPKCLAVAQVSSPTATMEYTLPAALQNVPLAVQVRTFAGDYENETIYRPLITETDAGGDQVDAILGTAVIAATQKRDAGGLRLLFAFTRSLSGLQPETFSLVKMTGPGTVPIAQVTATDERDYAIDVAGLTDGAAYTFDLIGHSGAVDTVLVAGIEFTADADGPAAVTGLVAEEY